MPFWDTLTSMASLSLSSGKLWVIRSSIGIFISRACLRKAMVVG